MSEYLLSNKRRRSPVCPAVALCIVLVSLLLVAACTSAQGPGNLATENQTPVPITTATPESKALYKVTIAQPNDTTHPDYIIMDSDIYNQGEVVEFYVVNKGTDTLTCTNNRASYLIIFQNENGTWEYLPEVGPPMLPKISYLKPGETLPPRRFVTTGWIPGRYRIVFDCGIMREFEIRSVTT
ncbi:hypothetical protein Metfor_1601 [Methanoregula formicica SMSP]|uniref:Intracellular proteinase inhibitor BsuPI domain-containing protein n=1 Tax=Methanoregula formicica (strain DSM 22288 / NBRC 105244 / SMSP) TaxID=593750 RepID=L0HFR4_METFS|nr:hypothetical protein Metfor_1601 [Methanoregula formicica SMSP]